MTNQSAAGHATALLPGADAAKTDEDDWFRKITQDPRFTDQNWRRILTRSSIDPDRTEIPFQIGPFQDGSCLKLDGNPC